jgi:hypothetical protein
MSKVINANLFIEMKTDLDPVLLNTDSLKLKLVDVFKVWFDETAEDLGQEVSGVIIIHTPAGDPDDSGT